MAGFTFGIPGRNKSESAIKDTKHVKHLRAIAEIFELLGLQSKAAPAVAEFLEEKKHVVRDIVDDELNNWGLQVADVEDGEIDSSNVKAVEFLDLTTYDAAGDGGQILVVGEIKMTVEISYTHPDWENSIYDSEDKVRMTFDNVSGKKEVELEAEFAMTILVDEAGMPEEVDHFAFSSDRFIWVDIEEPFEDYR